MSIFFASSDECGNFQLKPSKKFIKRTPYFSRATVLIEAEDWKALNNRLMTIRKEFGYEFVGEIKWSYIWSLYIYENSEERVPGNKPYELLSNVTDSMKLLELVEQTLQIMSEIAYCKIIITVSDNNKKITIPEAWHYERHLQELMQRIEMELQHDQTNLAIIFADPISETKDKSLREAYHSIYRRGDFIKNYSHIKDSLNFEYSHHSVGIQLADFVAGSFNGMLRGFETSTRIFHNYVKPFLRSDSIGNIMGYGIKELPKDDEFRQFISNKLLDK